jgi:hypothetical protein
MDSTNKPTDTPDQPGGGLNSMDFQLELHKDNQTRLLRLEDTQGKMLTQLTEIATNTSILPKLVERVEDLEGSRNKIKGAMALMIALGPLVDVGVKKVFHLV